ncbi:hypothetical protein PMAYCL1PPCAC_16721, partial [Pristionchus mayeri]
LAIMSIVIAWYSLNMCLTNAYMSIFPPFTFDFALNSSTRLSIWSWNVVHLQKEVLIPIRFSNCNVCHFPDVH